MPGSEFEMSDGEYQLPGGFDFELVDTTATTSSINQKKESDNTEKHKYEKESTQETEEEIRNKSDNKIAQEIEGDTNDKDAEFFFPLFASDRSCGSEEITDTNNLMKVSLKDYDEQEAIVQSRPEGYYFAKYSDEDMDKIKQSVIEYNDIFVSFDNRFKDKKCLDVAQYNKSLLKHEKRKRRSLKNRLNKIQSKKNVKDRKNKMEQLQKQEIKLINQKKKRGGKKNKKKKVSAEEKKFKTE